METVTMSRRGRPAIGGWATVIQARRRKELTQQSVAELCNVSQMTYSRWERGEDRPTRDNLRRLSEILEVSYDLLADETNKIFLAKKYH